MKMIVLCLLAVTMAGCANLNSIFRKTDTEEHKAETILIDAKERPITVNRVTYPNQPVTCVARSPDALSQAAASGNLKITQASGAGGEAGFATAEQVQSIAFRTQVTEAQQEFLYTLCQLHANGVLSPDDVSDNLRHFQNTMLAMVAIDDLASASRAKAPAAPAAGGDTDKLAAPDASDPKVQAVKAAQSDVDNGPNGVRTARKKVDSTAKTLKAVTDPAELTDPANALTGALKTYDQKQKSYAKALDQLQAKITALKGKDAKAPDDVTSAATDATAVLKEVTADYKTTTAAVAALPKTTAANLKDDQDTLASDLKDYTDAVGTYQTSEDALAKALKAWSAAADPAKAAKASKDAKDTGDAGSSGVSATVANDVAIIVQTIVWQSFITEQCQKVLFTPERFNATDGTVRFYCMGHLIRADDVREKLLLGTLAVPTPGTPTAPVQNLSPVGAPATPIQPFNSQIALDDLVEKTVQQRLKSMSAAPAPNPTPPQ